MSGEMPMPDFQEQAMRELRRIGVDMRRFGALSSSDDFMPGDVLRWLRTIPGGIGHAALMRLLDSSPAEGGPHVPGPDEPEAPDVATYVDVVPEPSDEDDEDSLAIPTPMFTQAELARAFAFLLPPDQAIRTAQQWFDSHAGDVDEHGRYVHARTWGLPPDPHAPGYEPRARPETPERAATDAMLFSRFFDEPIVEGFFDGLRDTHLALVALVNDETFERMAQVRHMTEAGARRNSLQLTRAIVAFRTARDMPPAAFASRAAVG